MPASKAQQKAVSKYIKNNYDEIKVRVAKGEKVQMQTHAQEMGESLNAFINRAMHETMGRDQSQPSQPETPSETLEATDFTSETAGIG